MTDISTRGYDGVGGTDQTVGHNIVHPQPDFANMTLEQIQQWELANSLAPETGAVPAEAVAPTVTPTPVAPALSLVQMDEDSRVTYTPPQPDGPEQAQLISADFNTGEPFIHVVAYLTAGPVEIIAKPEEALELYTQLGLALGAAQRAGAIT